jgi:hypothetical protein
VPFVILFDPVVLLRNGVDWNAFELVQKGLDLARPIWARRMVDSGRPNSSGDPWRLAWNSVGGGTTQVTTYTYNRKWTVTVPQAVNSFFKQGESCKTQNNGYACVNWNPMSESWWSLYGYILGSSNVETAKNVRAGDYVVPHSQLAQLGTSKVLTPACASSSSSSSTPAPTIAPSDVTTTFFANSSNTRRELQFSSTALVCSLGGASLQGSKMVWQQQDSNSQVVDYLTRSYSLRTADVVSILAKQKGDTFVFWESAYDDDYGLFNFVDGNLTAAEMLDQRRPSVSE